MKSMLKIICFCLVFVVISATATYAQAFQTANYEPESDKTRIPKNKAYECINIFVSNDGDDSADATIDNPLRTFEAARDMIRSVRQNNSNKLKINVYVRGGTYYFDKGLSLGELDSGTEDFPVTWQNYNNEKVTVTGAITLNGAGFTKVTDSTLLNRIVDSTARDSVYSISLTDHGIDVPADSYMLGAYSYSNSVLGLENGPKKPSVYDLEFFMDGKPMINARYPNNGEIAVDEVIDTGWSSDKPDVGTKGDPFTIRISDDRIQKWASAPENSILMYGFWKYNWADETVPLSSVDAEENTITSAWHSVFGASLSEGACTFYVYNLLEELDTPGEYFIDRQNGILYINADESIKDSQISVTVSDKMLISLNGADYVRFDGINVENTRMSAFYISQKSNGCVISNCEISYTSTTAVGIEGEYNTVRNCYIHDVDGGIAVSGGNSQVLQNAENRVMNCEIENFSRLTKTYKPAVALSGVGNLVAFNEIHESPHLAISYSGQNNKIYFNDIYNVVKNSDDAGAIYGGLSWLSRGHEIKYNYIHDIKSSKPANAGVWGIFGDGGQSGLLIEGNVLESIDGDGVFISGGQYNKILNNYAVNCKSLVRMRTSMTEANLNKHHYPELEENKKIYDNDVWREAFPELFDLLELDSQEQIKPLNNELKNNLCFNSEIGYTSGTDEIDTWIPDFQQYNMVSERDPGFESVGDNPDYTLSATSPAYDMMNGFYAIPFRCIGTQGGLSCIAEGDFHLDTYGDSCFVSLCHEGKEDAVALLSYALYNNDGNTDNLSKCSSMELYIRENVKTHKNTEISDCGQGELRCFLWDKNSGRPLCKSGRMARLTELRIDGDIIGAFSFDANITSYEVDVPITYDTDTESYTYNMPEITASADCTVGTATVKMPEVLPGTALINIVNNSGNVIAVYKVKINLAGLNMYYNSGFENSIDGKISSWIDGVSFVPYTADYKNGNQSANIIANASSAYRNTGICIPNAGKTYISSVWIKASPDTVNKDYRMYVERAVNPDTGQNLSLAEKQEGYSFNIKFYSNDILDKTVSESYRASSNTFTIGSEWSQKQAVIEHLKGEFLPQVFFIEKNWTYKVNALIDDAFFGELVASKIKVEDENKNSSITLPNGVGTVIKLHASIRNQLGTTAGFENEEIYFISTSPYVTTDSDGNVSVSETAPCGDYVVSAVSYISINNIGRTAGNYIITVN